MLAGPKDRGDTRVEIPVSRDADATLERHERSMLRLKLRARSGG